MDIKPQLNIDQGFVKKPYAIRKVITAPDGSTQIVHVDAKTGKPIGNPEGYQIIQNPTPSGTDTRQSKPSNTDIVRGEKENSNSAVSKAVEATKSDGQNYGYTDRPMVMGFAGFIPGPLGWAGTAANLGWNAKNQQAISEQRTALGFSTEPGKRALGTVFDTNGYIGEAKVTAPNGNVSIAPVSFEATDSNNRTAYTPEEARKREMMGLLTQATQQEQKAAIGTFNGQFPEQQSFSSKIAAASKGLMGNIFGSSSTPAGVGTGLGFNTGSAAGAYGTNSFPSAPSAPTNPTGRMNTPAGVDTSGMSPGLW